MASVQKIHKLGQKIPRVKREVLAKCGMRVPTERSRVRGNAINCLRCLR